MAHENTINGRLARICLYLAVPLFLLLAAANLFGIRTMERQMRALDQDNLNAAAQQIENRLTAIGDHVRTFCTLERDVTNMQYGGTETERLFAQNRLLTRMKNDALLYPQMFSEFIFGPQTDTRLIVYGDETDYDQRQMARRAIDELCRGITEGGAAWQNGWRRYTWEGGSFLLYLYRTDDACMGFLIRAQALLELSMLPADAADSAVSLCFAGETAAVLGKEDAEGWRLCADIGETGWSLVLSVERRGAQDPDFWLRGLLCVLPLILLAVIWLIYRLTAHALIVPVRSIAEAMRRAGGGDLHTRVETAGMVQELSLIGESFNDMLTRINTLQKHEQESIREREKSQLRSLQLQINPHFLGNCFNTIYNAAMNGENAQLLELVTYLSRYFRYMASMEREYVTLEQELGFTQDFLAIQKIRFGAQFEYQLYVPEYLKPLPVPPSSVKTFAENAVQHCRRHVVRLCVEIRAELHQEGGGQPMLWLTVTDNGPGFDPAVFAQLNGDEAPFFDGRRHLGIANVRQRLRLLYQEKASLTLGAAEGGGARVELKLPISHQTRGEEK